MRIFRRLALVAAACTTALVTAFSVATPASAAGTWTITPGGRFTATASQWAFSDTSTGTQLTCGSLTLSGFLSSGTGLSGTDVGQFQGVTTNSCTGPLGTTFAMTFQNLPWFINLMSFDPLSGRSYGTISGVEFHVGGVGCTFDVRGITATSPGTLNFTYTNGLHRMDITGGDLHAYNVSGSCLGLVNSGDPVEFTGSFDVEPPQTITSP